MTYHYYLTLEQIKEKFPHCNKEIQKLKEMKDKEFEATILDLNIVDANQAELIISFKENVPLYNVKDLEEAYLAGFDFEEASFEEWFSKFKNKHHE